MTTIRKNTEIITPANDLGTVVAVRKGLAIVHYTDESKTPEVFQVSELEAID